MVNISQRPAEADDRAIPGHWEGDLIAGPQLWVPETVLTAVDLLLRRPSEPGMIRRWR